MSSAKLPMYQLNSKCRKIGSLGDIFPAIWYFAGVLQKALKWKEVLLYVARK